MIVRIVMMALCLAVTAPAWGQTSSSADEEARALFQAGRVAYSHGRFDQALKHFEESYRLSGRPLLLLNIANCHDRLRNDRAALESFEKFVELAPDAEGVDTAKERIAFLKERVAEEQEQGQAEPPPTESGVASPEQAAEASVAEEQGDRADAMVAPDSRSEGASRKKKLIWGSVAGAVAAGVIVGIAVATAGGGGGVEDPARFDMNTRTRGL